MEQTVQADKDGTVHLPASLLPQGGPNTVYRVELKPDALVLSSVNHGGERAKVSKEEWVRRFREWTESHTAGPGLPASAVGRDGIYE
jgi:hypothetical protein